MSSEERRVLSRFRIEVPLSLQVPGRVATAQAKTRDINACGIFFYTEFELAPGTELAFVITLPPELTSTEGVQMICKAKVLRIQPDLASGYLGVAAAIHCFEFVAAAASAGVNNS